MTKLYSSFSLVQAIWEASDYGSKNYFFSHLTFYIGPYTPRAFRRGEKKISKMKNPWKTRHVFFRVDRVYIHKNDRLDLTVNEFFTVWKMMLLSKRYFQFFEFFHFTFLWITQFLQYLSAKLFREKRKCKYSFDIKKQTLQRFLSYLSVVWHFELCFSILCVN